eukprot:11226660-Lingulodinium_polyedra.AAC.1
MLLLDLKKAFEQVSHLGLLAAAQATGFPLWQLKLLIDLYRMARVLDLGGVCSEEVYTWQAILPGCGFATMLLQMMLIRPMDELRALCPAVSTSVVVDDLALQCMGGADRVEKNLVRAGRSCKRLLQGVELAIAPAKTRVLANDRALRSRLQQQLT